MLYDLGKEATNQTSASWTYDHDNIQGIGFMAYGENGTDEEFTCKLRVTIGSITVVKSVDMEILRKIFDAKYGGDTGLDAENFMLYVDLGMWAFNTSKRVYIELESTSSALLTSGNASDWIRPFAVSDELNNKERYQYISLTTDNDRIENVKYAWMYDTEDFFGDTDTVDVNGHSNSVGVLCAGHQLHSRTEKLDGNFAVLYNNGGIVSNLEYVFSNASENRVVVACCTDPMSFDDLVRSKRIVARKASFDKSINHKIVGPGGINPNLKYSKMPSKL